MAISEMLSKFTLMSITLGVYSPKEVTWHVCPRGGDGQKRAFRYREGLRFKSHGFGKVFKHSFPRRNPVSEKKKNTQICLILVNMPFYSLQLFGWQAGIFC